MLFRASLCLSFVAVGLLGCAARPSAETSAPTMPPPYQTLAQERFGKTYEAIPNADTTYILVTSQRGKSSQDPFPTLSLFIFDMARGKILFEDTVAKGRAAWKTNHTVEVTAVPGMLRGDESGDRLQGYLFDVRYGRKRPRFDPPR